MNYLCQKMKFPYVESPVSKEGEMSKITVKVTVEHKTLPKPDIFEETVVEKNKKEAK